MRGAVFAAIDMDRLLREALKDTELDLTFEIFDGRNPEESHRLNQFFAIPEPEDRVRRLDLTNRTLIWKKYIHQWAITFHPTPEFERHSPRRTGLGCVGCGARHHVCVSLRWSGSSHVGEWAPRPTPGRSPRRGKSLNLWPANEPRSAVTFTTACCSPSTR